MRRLMSSVLLLLFFFPPLLRRVRTTIQPFIRSPLTYLPLVICSLCSPLGHHQHPLLHFTKLKCQEKVTTHFAVTVATVGGDRKQKAHVSMTDVRRKQKRERRQSFVKETMTFIFFFLSAFLN